MEWIDIHMQVFQVEYQKLREMRQGESSADVRARVETARQRQRERFEGTDIASNADMRPALTMFAPLIFLRDYFGLLNGQIIDKFQPLSFFDK